MTLAIITDCLSRSAGGLFESVRRLSQELQTCGFNVRVFGIADRWTAADLHAWRPLEPIVVRRLGPKFFGYAPDLFKAIQAEQPSTLQVHGLWKYLSIAVVRASNATECPYVVNPHGMLDAWALRNSAWKKALAGLAYERRHLEGAACIRALCRSEADAVRTFGLRNPIAIVPNGIDLPESAPADRSVPAPFPAGRKVLLYLGRIHPKKGLPNLLQAWAMLRDSPARCARYDEWLLAIVGWDQGGHEADLRRRAAELGLGDSVAFLGPRFDSEKAACYRHCDAFVLPSFSEGLPMVILEAWAHAKPVLMTPECNLPEGFSAEAAVPTETSSESIAEGLRRLFDMSDAQREAMGLRGLALVKRCYTWSHVARQMAEVQNWVRSQGPCPSCIELT